MTAEEAAEAANLIKAKVTVPMHIASIVGSNADAERFQKLVHSPVTIMQKGV
jgi:L-ascorbate metabolism protein UlaG (beta-lactamase superfamily)